MGLNVVAEVQTATRFLGLRVMLATRELCYYQLFYNSKRHHVSTHWLVGRLSAQRDYSSTEGLRFMRQHTVNATKT